MINFFRSNKKRDFIAYWELTKFEELLSKGIEVGSEYFFLVKFIGIFLLTITKTYILLSCAVFFCTFGIGMFNPTINSLISQKINKNQMKIASNIFNYLRRLKKKIN